MKSPIVIIFELLSGLVMGALDTVLFVVEKLFELIVSLVFLSSLGPIGLVLALVIGGVVFYFMSTFVFKTSRSMLSIGIAALVVLLVLILLR